MANLSLLSGFIHLARAGPIYRVCIAFNTITSNQRQNENLQQNYLSSIS